MKRFVILLGVLFQAVCFGAETGIPEALPERFFSESTFSEFLTNLEKENFTPSCTPEAAGKIREYLCPLYSGLYPDYFYPEGTLFSEFVSFDPTWYEPYRGKTVRELVGIARSRALVENRGRKISLQEAAETLAGVQAKTGGSLFMGEGESYYCNIPGLEQQEVDLLEARKLMNVIILDQPYNHIFIGGDEAVAEKHLSDLCVVMEAYNRNLFEILKARIEAEKVASQKASDDARKCGSAR